MITSVRHQSAPPPLGCRWCGVKERLHAFRWVPSKRWHAWEQPTPEQINARLRVRLSKNQKT